MPCYKTSIYHLKLLTDLILMHRSKRTNIKTSWKNPSRFAPVLNLQQITLHYHHLVTTLSFPTFPMLHNFTCMLNPTGGLTSLHPMLIRPIRTLPKVMAPSMSMTSDVGEDPSSSAIKWVISYPNNGPDWNLYIPYKSSLYPGIVYTPNNNGEHEFCSKSLVCWITFRMRGSGAYPKRSLSSGSILTLRFWASKKGGTYQENPY